MADNDCNRISGFGVLSDSGNGFVEWAWVLGYSSCNGVYYTTPRTFTYWRSDGGQIQCAVWGSAFSVFHEMTLQDANQDTEWSAKLDGDVKDVMNVNWATGDIVTNGERDCTCDSAWSHFRFLKFQVAGSTTFYNWSDPDLHYDNDNYPPNGYQWVYNSNTEHHIVRT